MTQQDTYPEAAWVNALQGLTMTPVTKPIHDAETMLIRSKFAGKNEDWNRTSNRTPQDRTAYCDLVNVPLAERDNGPDDVTRDMQTEHERDVDECLALLKLLKDKVQRISGKKLCPTTGIRIMRQNAPGRHKELRDNHGIIFDAAKQHLESE